MFRVIIAACLFERENATAEDAKDAEEINYYSTRSRSAPGLSKPHKANTWAHLQHSSSASFASSAVASRSKFEF